MSPAKQKLIGKDAGKGNKTFSRQSSASGGVCASAYNPVSCTFHHLESVTSDPGSSNHNGRFRPIDDVDNHNGPNGAGAEYDSMSMNSSWSGESEDQLHVNGREKQGCGRLGVPPRLVGGVDKREKIREKNERKHQRQRERRAHELRDRCTGYLVSRKLETLAQQLVSMGFNHERATLALILNKGNVEQAVAWLLDGGEGQMKEHCKMKEDVIADENLKIDISEELARIAEIESKYKYTRPEIDRAIVSCKGDLDRALQWLQIRCRSISPARVQEQSASASRRHCSGHANEHPPLPDPVSSATSWPVQTNNSALLQDDLQSNVDFCSSKSWLQSSSYKIPHTIPEGGAKGVFSSGSPSLVSTNWQRTPLLADKRGSNHGEKPPSTSTHTLSHTHVTSVHGEANSMSDSAPPNHVRTVEGKSQHSTSREYAVPTQLSQGLSTGTASSTSTSMIMNVCSASAAALSSRSGWNNNVIGECPPTSSFDVINASGDLTMKVGIVDNQKIVSKAGTDLQGYYHPLFSTQLNTVAASLTSGRSGLVVPDTLQASRSLLSHSSHPRGSQVTSFGLYNGCGSDIYGSSVDWSRGSIVNCDYNNIDWSMGGSPSSSLEVGGIWGLSSSLMSLKLSDLKFEQCLDKDIWFQATSGSAVRVNESDNTYDIWTGVNQKGSTAVLGIQDQSRVEFKNTTDFGEHEQTSPFAGKELFSLPQQAVPSP